MASVQRAIMPQKRPSRLFVFVALLTVMSMLLPMLGMRNAAAQTVETPLADAVPATTPIFIEANLDQSSAQWEMFWQLYDRAGIAGTAGASADDLKAAIADSGADGTVAFAFMDPAGLVETATADMTSQPFTGMAAFDPTSMTANVPAGTVILIKPNDVTTIEQEFSDQVMRDAKTANAEVMTTDYNGTTITYYEAAESDVPPTAYAVVDGTLVTATRLHDVKTVIDTMSGETPALSSNEQFTTVRDTFTTDALAFGYVDSNAMNQAMMQVDPTAASPADSAGQQGWVVYASELGLHIDSVDTATPTLTPTDLTADTTTAADAAFFMTGPSLAQLGLADTFGMILQAAMGASLSMATPTVAATPTIDETFALLEGQLGFNPKTDLLDLLDGQWEITGGLGDMADGGMLPSIVFSSESSDGQTAQDSLSKITFILTSLVGDNATVSERTVDGGNLSVVTLSNDLTGMGDITIEYGVVNDTVIISFNGGLDTYLNATGDTLAANDQYVKTFDALPNENAVGKAYVNLADLLPVIASTIQSGTTVTSSRIADADASCGEYNTQADAQAAYDADTANLWKLDMDFDGQACEDFFAPATPATADATPVSGMSELNVLSFGQVTYIDGDMTRTNGIILIGD